MPSLLHLNSHQYPAFPAIRGERWVGWAFLDLNSSHPLNSVCGCPSPRPSSLSHELWEGRSFDLPSIPVNFPLFHFHFSGISHGKETCAHCIQFFSFYSFMNQLQTSFGLTILLVLSDAP